MPIYFIQYLARHFITSSCAEPGSKARDFFYHAHLSTRNPELNLIRFNFPLTYLMLRNVNLFSDRWELTFLHLEWLAFFI